MNKLKTIKDNVGEIAIELYKLIKSIPPIYTQRFYEISEVCRLRDQVAILSNCRVADALMDIVKQIAYTKPESNYDICCAYLKSAIEDLLSGMDQTDVLLKYEDILYRYNGGRL